jgi:hypothetical protein
MTVDLGAVSNKNVFPGVKARNHWGNPIEGQERNYYGVRFMRNWPQISLGMSLHIDRKYGHLSLHTPFGVIIFGFIGADHPTKKTWRWST